MSTVDEDAPFLQGVILMWNRYLLKKTKEENPLSLIGCTIDISAFTFVI